MESGMAIIKCHECGNEISSEAKVCPQCGAKNRSYSKKWSATFLVVVVLGFVAYYIFEAELNPNIPVCDSSHGRKVFKGSFENSPFAQNECPPAVCANGQL